jgi:hypothetical protein
MRPEGTSGERLTEFYPKTFFKEHELKTFRTESQVGASKNLDRGV